MKYEKPVMEIMEIGEDVITTSTPGGFIPEENLGGNQTVTPM